MNPGDGCLLAGIFSVLNSIQFLILEVWQPVVIGEDLAIGLYMPTNSTLVSWLIDNKSGLGAVPSGLTVAAGVLLLLCRARRRHAGLLLYALWIVAYELAHFTLALLLHGAIRPRFRALTRLYLLLQVSRMLVHFSFLPFVLWHAHALFKDSSQFVKGHQRRRSSSSTVDSSMRVPLWPTYRKGRNN